MSEFEKEYRIAQLLAKKMAGELSPEEELELHEWGNTSLSATELDKRILDPENKRQRDEFVNSLNTKSSWQKVEKSISRKRHTSRNLVWWSGVAAAIIIALVMILPESQVPVNPVLPLAEIQSGSSKAILITPEGKQFNLSQQDSSRTLELGHGLIAINNGNVVEYVERSDSSIHQKMRNNTIRVPRGGEYELILPDGTHVWINSDSELSFPARFDSTKREVSLSGEAYFSVRRDKKRPFTVKVGQNVEVNVLGTQFNLQAYPDAKTIETTLCEGSVNVSNGKQKVTLTPSQQAVYSKATMNITTRKVDVRLYSAWKEGLFVFENKPLEEIMTTLSRWYNVNVFYANQALKTYHFTGDLERYGDFKKTLGMIEKATSIRFKINGNNITVEEILTK
ncbi:MAG: DUF4974 domain-containing protein [Butyricimonas virosa]|nr:DUF4974 domain-containing protein [Butyricimonas virosa]